ncbi:hypothetical protein [Micrococcus luteus]
MNSDILDKKPAFFPSAAAELFFESENETANRDILDTQLDSELDQVLKGI